MSDSQHLPLVLTGDHSFVQADTFAEAKAWIAISEPPISVTKNLPETLILSLSGVLERIRPIEKLCFSEVNWTQHLAQWEGPCTESFWFCCQKALAAEQPGTAAAWLRQALALRPSLMLFVELARVLRAQGKNGDSRRILRVLFVFAFSSYPLAEDIDEEKRHADDNEIPWGRSTLLDPTDLRAQQLVTVVALSLMETLYLLHRPRELDWVCGYANEAFADPDHRARWGGYPVCDWHPCLVEHSLRKQLDKMVKAKVLSSRTQGNKRCYFILEGYRPRSFRYFLAGQRPVKLAGWLELAWDWEWGEFVRTDIYNAKIFRDHAPDIEAISQDQFEQRVEELRAKHAAEAASASAR